MYVSSLETVGVYNDLIGQPDNCAIIFVDGAVADIVL